MNKKTVLHGLMLVSAGLACAAPAAKNAAPAADALTSDKERDSFAIAEHLYHRANVEGLDDAARRNIFTRVSDLLKQFVKEFPDSVNKTKALYMRAICEEKLGHAEELNKVYKQLADSARKNVKDEYVATAAYKLATSSFNRSLQQQATEAALKEAAAYFEIVERCSSKTKLVYDAKFRHARALTGIGQLRSGKSAEEAYHQAAALYEVIVKNAADVPEYILSAAYYAYAMLLSEIGGTEQFKNALVQFDHFLSSRTENAQQRGFACRQAARIAAKLNLTDKSVEYYDKVKGFACMNAYFNEVDMEILLVLYHANRYEAIRSKFAGGAAETPFLKDTKLSEMDRAQAAGILGHAYMQDKNYAKATGFFLLAEELSPDPRRRADSGYRYIICLQQLPKGQQHADLADYCKKFLDKYDSADAVETSSMPCMDIVRVIYADHKMKLNQELPCGDYLSINMDNLPDDILEDTAYKKAWCLFREWSDHPASATSPESALNYYIAEDKIKDKRHLPDVLYMRGNYLFDSEKYENAIDDFKRVIEQYKDSPAYPACLQRAAHACMNCRPARNDEAKKYFIALLDYAEQVESDAARHSESISSYVLAEANFSLGRLCYQDEPEKSIVYFENAIKANDKDYAASASACIIQCYFKLKNTEKARLLAELPRFKQKYPEQYAALPRPIPRWCGWAWYQDAENNVNQAGKNLEYYQLSVEFLNDAIDRRKTETYTNAEGVQQQRPVAEAVVWLTLARACLEVEQYQSTEKRIGGVDAINYYLSMEKDAHRRADGLKTKAMLLNGSGSPAQAMEVCTEALNLGVNGPVLSSIRLVAGDAEYLLGNYEKASQLYGLVANFDRNNDLNREALYKAACALRKNGKEAEAANYEKRLEEKLKEMKIRVDKPLEGLPPSVGRHVSHR